MLDRHFLDSLMILRSKTDLKTGKMIDVGTGAGFPGMVLALACPGLQVTLLDAQKKRLDFLQEVKEKTDAKNVLLIHGRAEEYARKKDYREKFDFAAARAVAPLNTLCEYLLPFLRIGGTALCWKGPSVMNEIVPGRNASEILGGSLEMPLSCPVEGRDWKHLILPVRKIRKTPEQYPRKAGTPKTKPLGS